MKLTCGLKEKRKREKEDRLKKRPERKKETEKCQKETTTVTEGKGKKGSRA